MLHFYTGQIGLKYPNVVDISVKSGNQAFAPTWSMVNGLHDKLLSEEKYTELYYDKMRDSYRNQRQEWNKILSAQELIFVCYCPPEKFCHRLLLADILQKLGAFYLGEI